MENRNGLVVDARLTQADGYAERAAALEMLGEVPAGRRVTLGADRGYRQGQRSRKRIEEVFGWVFRFTAAAYDLVRLRNLTLTSA